MLRLPRGQKKSWYTKTPHYLRLYNIFQKKKAVNKTFTVNYELNGGEWSSDLADVVAGDATILDAGEAAADIRIQWKWAFDGVDSTDTALGELARDGSAPTVTVEANISANQYVNP